MNCKLLICLIVSLIITGLYLRMTSVEKFKNKNRIIKSSCEYIITSDDIKKSMDIETIKKLNGEQSNTKDVIEPNLDDANNSDSTTLETENAEDGLNTSNNTALSDSSLQSAPYVCKKTDKTYEEGARCSNVNLTNSNSCCSQLNPQGELEKFTWDMPKQFNISNVTQKNTSSINTNTKQDQNSSFEQYLNTPV